MRLEIIAELHPQHGGSKDTIRKMIKLAKENGADVAKFQLYSSQGLMGVKDWEYLEFSKDEVAQLMDWCKQENIEFMASVFDQERFSWLEELGVKRHKIASRTLIEDMDLCNAIISTKKETLVSLGKWKSEKRPFASSELIKYLYCVVKYPAQINDFNNFPVDFSAVEYCGFSDHSIGINLSLLAIAKGAQVIEKHFTLDKSRYRETEKAHSCSMTPNELNELRKSGDKIYSAFQGLRKLK